MNNYLQISEKTKKLVKECEEELKEEFSKWDSLCFDNTMKVLSAFKKNKVATADLNGTTGYGYNDIGRDKIEAIFSDVLGGEDALVRSQIVSGTHALTVCFFALLRPSETILSITGTPYDTLHEVIGIKDNSSSLKSFGINYKQIDLKDDNFDIDLIKTTLKNNKIKLIHIQRSKGYSLRKSILISDIENVIKEIRTVDKDVIIMVDNCYCEFVESKSPLEVGADIIVGSLIKNLGAGEVPNGGYVVGRKDLIKLVSESLLIPGEGKNIGATLNMNKDFLKGIYMAPQVVNSSVKVAVLTSKIFEKLGYQVYPKYDSKRADIVEAIVFNDEAKLLNYVRGIQEGSAIDSFVSVIFDDMPGYSDKIVMASGSFIQGSTIELSCDAPLKKPYVAYQQGGLSYEYGKLGVMIAISKLLDE